MSFKSWSRIWLVALSISGAIGTGFSSAQPSVGDGTNAGVKRALLIGINKYKAVPRLQGSLNDIETMRQILITRWGFSERNITMVTDEAATRAGILAALEQLVRDTGPQDTVYFHYSGHGSQVEDLNGDEKDDQLDETLVPQDGRSGDVRDITDDELDAIFVRLRARNALIVLDSCHSGTATRSLDIRTRSIPRDTRVDIYRKAEQATPKTRAVVPVMTSRFVVMTGAASHQEALDGPVDGRYHGFFTYALSKSLSSSSPAASPREVFAGVERELKRIQTHFGRSSMPEPQLEAPPELLDKSLLSQSVSPSQSPGATQSARLPWLEVQPGEGSLVTLVNGLLLGAGPDSTWAIYPPGETSFTPGRAVAVATVTQITGKDSVAMLQTAGGKIRQGSRAVALLPAPTGEKIPIRILDLPKDRRKQIEDTLSRNIKDVELVGPEKTARFLVDSHGNSLRLLAADGLQVVASFELDNDQWGDGLAVVISRSANASELLTLDNPSSQIKVEVRVVNTPKPATRAKKPTTRGVAVVADTQPGRYRIRRPGQPRTLTNSLQLEIRTNADCYLTVVDVDSQGGVNLLFPNDYQQKSFYPDGRIHAGKAMLIPDSLQPGNRAGFYWDYTPPEGTDTIRVFTSTDLETAHMVRERVRALQASAAQTRGGVATRAAVAASVGSLRQNLAKVATRGFITVYDPTPPALTAQAPSAGQPGMEFPGASSSQLPPEPQSTQSVASSSPDLTAPPGQTAPDWAATSVTILVEG